MFEIRQYDVANLIENRIIYIQLLLGMSWYRFLLCSWFNLCHWMLSNDRVIPSCCLDKSQYHSVIFSHRVVFFLQGVVEFSLCLLFAKLVSYTFLYWLPLYISNVGKNPSSHYLVFTRFLAQMNCQKSHGVCSLLANFDPKEAGDLSTLFDVGGIVGKYVLFKLFVGIRNM